MSRNIFPLNNPQVNHTIIHPPIHPKTGCNPIPHIEEANMFLDDGKVIHFENPKLQASLAANTYVITGNSEKKNLQDLHWPGFSVQNPMCAHTLRFLRLSVQRFAEL